MLSWTLILIMGSWEHKMWSCYQITYPFINLCHIGRSIVVIIRTCWSVPLYETCKHPGEEIPASICMVLTMYVACHLEIGKKLCSSWKQATWMCGYTVLLICCIHMPNMVCLSLSVSTIWITCCIVWIYLTERHCIGTTAPVGWISKLYVPW